MKPKAQKPAKPTGAQAARNSKTYLARLAAEGVSQAPTRPQVRPVRQFQLAHLAATLARGANGEASASKLAQEAMQIWNAAGKVLFVEGQANELVKGSFCLNEEDWQAHANALIASLNDVDGAVPGQNPTNEVQKRHEAAQRDAGAAVFRMWKHGPQNVDALKALFPNDSETIATREKKFVELLQYAKGITEKSDRLAWNEEDSDKLNGVVLQTWEPLGLWNDQALDKAVGQAKQLLDNPGAALLGFRFSFNPIVARWLAVMRLRQLAAARDRSSA